MSSEHGRELTLYIEHSLAQMQEKPGFVLEAATRLNSEINARFDIERFLKSLNDTFFEGKGEVKALIHYYELIPEVDEAPGRSRFKQVFALKGKVDSVTTVMELSVKGKDLKLKSTIEYFDGINIRVNQIVNTTNGSYSIFVNGAMLFKSYGRDHRGTWDDKQAFPKLVSHGRFLTFPFQSVPPADEVAIILLRNIEEVLAGLAMQELIPNLAQEGVNKSTG